MTSLDGRTALVTGASGAIGRACAVALAGPGREVAGSTIVAEVGHDGAPMRYFGKVLQFLLEVIVAEKGKGDGKE